MKLHVVGLPHTQLTLDYVSCAYTMKLYRLGKMMRPLGYEVVLYGGEECTAECDEFVPLITRDECEEWFGPADFNQFYPITWDPNDVHWRVMNARAISAIRERRDSERDLLLLIAGNCQAEIAQGLPDMIACEWGVGYEGVFSNHCAYESAAWMHHVYGKRGFVDGRFYDAVIPNFFDPDDFYATRQKDDDYLLFIGRLVMRKGPHIAAQIAERAGMRLLVAGPGAVSVEPGKIVCNEITIEGDHVKHVGPVGIDERAALMANARATIVPTIYIEPFGGVAVESMLSGTPVIATDFGAFTETVEPGITGERFHTLAEGASAVWRCAELDPIAVRDRAISRYSLEAVGPQFDAWFKRLSGLWGEGWYS